MKRQLVRILTDQRGVALSMALLALLILGALVIAFSVLAASEPTIANNQLRVAQARAAAEAGLERAIWALTAGTQAVPPAGAIAALPAAAPYDGATFVPVTVSAGAVQVGGFRVTVTAGAQVNERTVDALGFAPAENGAGRSRQHITATVMQLRNIAGEAPCALCVRGDLNITGNSVVNARVPTDPSCGNKAGTLTTGLTNIGSGAAHVYGYNGTAPNGNVVGSDPTGPFDIIQPANPAQAQQFQDAFDAFAFKPHELDTLKAIAKSRGTYYQGAVTFNASNKMPDGIIFIDTTTGNNITDSTPVSEFGSLTVHGNAGMNANNTFNGWVIVNGSASLSGNLRVNGMVYAVNDVSYAGTGTGQISGLMVSANIRDVVATQIYDSTTTGNSAITFSCANARQGGGQVPPNFFVKAGTYREVSD
jgi:hypothetical protein